jgi:hypothetical protein
MTIGRSDEDENAEDSQREEHNEAENSIQKGITIV